MEEYCIIVQTGGYVLGVETYSKELESELESGNQNSLTKKWVWDTFPNYKEAKKCALEIEGTF